MSIGYDWGIDGQGGPYDPFDGPDDMPPSYCAGDRVLTEFGLGTVVYVRMAPPGYNVQIAVSVFLDGKRGRPGYSGSMFAPQDITHATEDEEVAT